ncbi:hypothetical protein NEOLI_005448, partial [Neolecta irregularis DAH-3]
SFSADKFKSKVVKWITTRNHPLREVETPEFHEMIAAANIDAKPHIFANHQSIRDHILSEYHCNKGIITEHLAQAQSKIHITFDSWTTRSGQHALTGICVHYLDDQGQVRDYLLALPEQLGQHFGINYAEVIGNVIAEYNLMDRIGYFVSDNARNNDTSHILNLVAQSILWGKDKDAFDNENKNIPDEEKFLKEWQKEGPLGTLIDILFSINTPFKHELFNSYQVAENNLLPKNEFIPLNIIKPVKTRWNAFLDSFEQAIQLRGPIDSFVQYHINKWQRETASLRVKGKTIPKPSLYIQLGGLNSYDWDVISNYIAILQLLKEATKKLEARGRAGRHGAIWEVIPIMDWLLRTFEEG